MNEKGLPWHFTNIPKSLCVDTTIQMPSAK
jgi:hypothetical protein